MKKITLHFLWVVVALGMGFHTEARVLNRFTCKGPLHYLEALSHDTSKGISNCLKAGYKAAHTPDSKLAKELAYLGGKSRYGQPLSVMIYLREEMLMKSVDSEFQPDPAFLNQESNRLYAAVFNASSGKGQRHHNAGSISHDIDLGGHS
jgi:hypothetical protein